MLCTYLNIFRLFIVTMSKTNKSSFKYIQKDVQGAKISNLIKHGRVEVTSKKQLEKYSIGSLISYISKSGRYRPGGFITKFCDDSFIYITPDFSTKFRVYYDFVDKMWVGDVYKVHNDIISFTGTTQKQTKYPVKIGDTVVYYASKSFDMDRFVNTKKYHIMKSWYDYFVDH